MKFVATLGGRAHSIDVSGEGGSYRLTIADPERPDTPVTWDVDARLTAQGIYSILIDGISYVADVTDRQTDSGDAADRSSIVEVGGETYVIDVEEATRHIIRTRGGTATTGAGQIVKSPMPGRVTRVAVAAGDRVASGDTLVIVEAMKMENEFKAATTGTVVEIRVEAGQAVNSGDVLVVIGPSS